MLSLGFAAFDEDEREVGVFEANLETLEGVRALTAALRASLLASRRVRIRPCYNSIVRTDLV